MEKLKSFVKIIKTGLKYFGVILALGKALQVFSDELQKITPNDEENV